MALSCGRYSWREMKQQVFLCKLQELQSCNATPQNLLVGLVHKATDYVSS